MIWLLYPYFVDRGICSSILDQLFIPPVGKLNGLGNIYKVPLSCKQPDRQQNGSFLHACIPKEKSVGRREVKAASVGRLQLGIVGF